MNPILSFFSSISSILGPIIDFVLKRNSEKTNTSLETNLNVLTDNILQKIAEQLDDIESSDKINNIITEKIKDYNEIFSAQQEVIKRDIYFKLFIISNFIVEIKVKECSTIIEKCKRLKMICKEGKNRMNDVNGKGITMDNVLFFLLLVLFIGILAYLLYQYQFIDRLLEIFYDHKCWLAS